MKQSFEAPVVVTYDRDELVAETAFTGLANSGPQGP